MLNYNSDGFTWVIQQVTFWEDEDGTDFNRMRVSVYASYVSEETAWWDLLTLLEDAREPIPFDPTARFYRLVKRERGECM